MKEEEIIRVFSSGFNRELTINQVAKLIKKSYAFTNTTVHQLINEGILKRRIIGSSILCSLNLASEKAIAFLVFNSIGRTNGFMKSLDDTKRKKLLELTRELENHPILTAYLVGSEVNVVTQDKSQIKLAQKSFKTKIMSKSEFESIVKSIDFPKMIIIHNHERFWRLMSKSVWFS